MAADEERTHFTAHVSIKKVVRTPPSTRSPDRMHNPTPGQTAEREVVDLADFSFRSEDLDSLKGRVATVIDLTEDD